MKKTIKVDLPDNILVGLTPHELHAPLGRAEDAHKATLAALDARRSELAAAEHAVTTLPAAITAGIAPAAALAAAMIARDAAALLVPSAELAAAEAGDRVEVEKARAKTALEAEVRRRQKQLVELAHEIAPALAEIARLDIALSRTLDKHNYGSKALDWPCSPKSAFAQRGRALSRGTPK